MAKKKSTGLGRSVLFQDTGPQEQEDVQQSSSPDVKQSKRQEVQTSDERIQAYLDGERVQATHYISEETHLRLEAARLQLKRMVGDKISKDKRGLVTKSLLTELALQIILDEVEEQGTDSRLAERLAGL